ncbi:hypothetical protein [Bacillus alkalisoli]|uniref:hypothetical protein n=1 Tax=Bacillus alkalisoli TaxID=2011008 RepID=UPI0012FF33F1|nr:hypothetical protein [Bacillus alkalisoli]
MCGKCHDHDHKKHYNDCHCKRPLGYVESFCCDDYKEEHKCYGDKIVCCCEWVKVCHCKKCKPVEKKKDCCECHRCHKCGKKKRYSDY